MKVNELHHEESNERSNWQLHYFILMWFIHARNSAVWSHWLILSQLITGLTGKERGKRHFGTHFRSTCLLRLWNHYESTQCGAANTQSDWFLHFRSPFFHSCFEFESAAAKGKTSLLVFYIFHKHIHKRLHQLLFCNTVSHVPVLFYHAIKLTTMGKL